MTEKLFYENSYMKEFEATVFECIPVGKFWNIVLDKTAFFPEGGGQYADTGFLNDAKVLDVQEKSDIIFHKLNQPLEPGTCVSGKINWEERFMKMQQHTGEHIVSGLVHAHFGYNNVGFHLGSEDCTMDFNGEITKEELLKIEYLANEAVVKNLEVQVTYPAKEELQNLEYRSKIEIEGQVRIVTIPGYDVCACCAPHVSRTGEIGLIKLTNVVRYKGGVRVTMLCGFRALDDYNKKLTSARDISAQLCAKEDEIAEAVEHLRQECAQVKQKNHFLQEEILKRKAMSAEAENGIVCLFEQNLEGDAPRFLMNQVLHTECMLCAVFTCQGEKKQTEAVLTESSEQNVCKQNSYRYVIGSKSLNLRDFVKELNAAFEGRGGGKPEMVQGSLKGNEEELRAWIQMKVRKMYE